MSYLIVSVSHRSDPNFIPSNRPPRRSLDGRLLQAGTYASQVKEILSEQPIDGRYISCGYHVVLWPMDQHAPLYETLPLQFGPFPSRARAEAFVREVSTEVKPVEDARAPARAPASQPDIAVAANVLRASRGAG
jgi:hypothetical protein